MRHIVAILSAFAVVMATDARAQGIDSWVSRDKAVHFAAGSTLAAGGYALGALRFKEPEKRVFTGLGLALGAGAAKESRDRRSGGDPSWRDFTWGSVGAATGVTIAWLIDRVRHHRRARSGSQAYLPFTLP